MKIEAEIEIGCHVADVCAVFTDPTAAPRWMSNLERFEVVVGNAGQPGAHARLHYLEKGHRTVMDDFLLEVKPGSHYLSGVRAGGLKARVEIRLESKGSSTFIRMIWDGTRSSFFTRIVLRLLRRKIEAGIANDLNSLKRLIEERLTR